MRLIDVDELMKNAEKCSNHLSYTESRVVLGRLKMAIGMTKKVDPVKRAHWFEENTVMAKFVRCSNCGIYIRVARKGKNNERYYLYSDEMKFCPSCGSKMDEVTE